MPRQGLGLETQAGRQQFRNAIVEIATGELGYVERFGNNTKYGEWFGLNGHPWCGMFVSWVYAQAAKRVGCDNPLIAVHPPKGFAGVTAAYSTMKRRGWILGPTDSLLPGDIVLWDHDHIPGGNGHTGLMISKQAEDAYTTIEGNTNTAFSRTGGAVCEHHHRIGDGKHGVLLGFARPTRKFGP